MCSAVGLHTNRRQGGPVSQPSVSCYALSSSVVGTCLDLVDGSRPAMGSLSAITAVWQVCPPGPGAHEDKVQATNWRALQEVVRTRLNAAMKSSMRDVLGASRYVRRIVRQIGLRSVRECVFARLLQPRHPPIWRRGLYHRWKESRPSNKRLTVCRTRHAYFSDTHKSLALAINRSLSPSQSSERKGESSILLHRSKCGLPKLG